MANDWIVPWPWPYDVRLDSPERRYLNTLPDDVLLAMWEAEHGDHALLAEDLYFVMNFRGLGEHCAV